MVTRREAVRLDLEDHFSSGMVKAAGSAKLLERELNSLSGTAVRSNRTLDDSERQVTKTGKSAEQSGKQIDKLSGRMALLAQTAVTLGPALIPIGAAGIPAIAGLATELGAAAGAVGVAVLAFHGMGDALKALDAYQLEPTTANLAKMREEMDKLGPDGAHFVRFLDGLEPQLRTLQHIAQAGMLPGIEEGITSLLTKLPRLKSIVAELATGLGQLAREAGDSLAGPQWRSFFQFVDREARPMLDALGHTLGNVALGFADLIVAFEPLSRSFAAGLEGMSAAFANWAAHLDTNKGFQDFLDYLRDSGPKAVEFLGALVQALAGLVHAAAPMGSVVLPILTQVANAFAALANSSIGPELYTAAAAMLAFNRAAKLLETTALVKIGSGAMAAVSGVRTLAADFTLLGTSAMTAGAKSEREMARIAESTRRANMAMSSLGRGLTFAAVITGIGLVNSAFDGLRNNIDSVNLDRNLQALSRGVQVADLQGLGNNLRDVYSTMTHIYDKTSDVLTLGFDTSELERSQAEIEKVDQALAAMVESGHAAEARKAFEQIVAAGEKAGVSAHDVAKAFDAYGTAIGNVVPPTQQAATVTDQYAGATGSAGVAAGLTRSKIAGLAKAMLDQKNAALSAFDAETQYRQALKDAAAQAAKNNAGIKGNSDAALKNRGALSQLAAAWNNQSDAVKNNSKRFAQARQDFIQTAEAMGVPKQAAIDLANHILAIPKARVINIAMKGDGAALSQIARIKAELSSVPRSIRTDYYVNQVNSISRPGAPTPGSADGSTVPKDNLPYADRYLYALAPGEEVISNRHGQADRNRALLKAINAGYLADGGTATSTPKKPKWHMPNPGIPGFEGWAPTLDHNGRALNEALHYFETHLHDAGKNLERLGAHLTKELTARQDLLKQEADREKQRLDMLKQERQQLADSISQAFHTDMFSASQQQPVTVNAATLPANFDTMTPAEQAAALAGQRSALQTQYQLNNTVNLTGQREALQSGIADKREALRLLKELRRRGLPMGPLINLALQGDVATLRAYAGLSNADLRQYASLYSQDRRLEARLGSYVGDQKYGAAINAQTAELQQTRGELKHVNEQLRDVKHELVQIKHIEAEIRKHHAHEVAAAVNGAATAGHKRRVAS